MSAVAGKEDEMVMGLGLGLGLGLMTDGHVFMTHAYGYCVLLCWVYISERLSYSCLLRFTCENRFGSGVSVLGFWELSGIV